MDALRHFRVLVQGFGFWIEKINLKNKSKKNNFKNISKSFEDRNSKRKSKKIRKKNLKKKIENEMKMGKK